MPSCTVDLSYSVLTRQLDKLSKKFPAIRSDLQRLCKEIESDYQSPKLNQFRIPMHGHGDGTFEAWKYDLKSSDLGKHARESFRFLCVCLDPTHHPRHFHGILLYFKSETENVTPKAIAAEVRQLRSNLNADDPI